MPTDESARASTKELLQFLRLLLRPVVVIGIGVFAAAGILLYVL